MSPTDHKASSGRVGNCSEGKGHHYQNPALCWVLFVGHSAKNSCWWTAATWPRDQSRRVTSCGGWHLGHKLVRGQDGAGRVTVRSRTGGTRVQDVGDAHAVCYSRWFGGWSSENNPRLHTKGFWPSLDSKLGGGGSSGNQRWHVASSRRVHQGEATSCGACGHQIKILRVGPFHLRLSG
jgi:hypothetical protein